MKGKPEVSSFVESDVEGEEAMYLCEEEDDI